MLKKMLIVLGVLAFLLSVINGVPTILAGDQSEPPAGWSSDIDVVLSGGTPLDGQLLRFTAIDDGRTYHGPEGLVLILP